MIYHNPVIKGFNPDPSICRVRDDFYLVTSSFEFFPGVPIFHSKNLVNWELIGHCLTRNSQLDLSGSRNSGGIYAPTIRYHDGIFYMTTTNTSSRGNFIVYTADIAGAWSEPHWVDQGGIDPSLFFDDDGSVYFCSTQNENGRQGIGLCKVDPFTGEKLTPTKIISFGAGGKYPEAPHIYKINGIYYLMMAEGGTEYGHMETIFRSAEPYGPYEACPYNPVLSHKDNMDLSIQATGHADLTDDLNSNWWLICLGIRPLNGRMLHNLGRETFLTPVQWDRDGWPVVGSQGCISLEMAGELPAAARENNIAFHDDFDQLVLNKAWTFVRNPENSRYDLSDHPGCLKLSGNEQDLNSYNPTFIGLRQQEFEVCAETLLSANLNKNGGKAGITAFYNKDYYYACYLTQEQDQYFVVLEKQIHDIHEITVRQPIEYHGEIALKIDTGMTNYIFSYRLGDKWISLGSAATAGLCTEGTMDMSFTGTMLGIFACRAEAWYDCFDISAL